MDLLADYALNALSTIVCIFDANDLARQITGVSVRGLFLNFTATMLIAGCASSPGPTLAELDARRERNIAASTALYEGVSAEQLRSASFEVLKLLNPSEMHFDVRPDRLLAAQTWRFTLITAASSGERWYEIKFVPEADGTRVSFAADEVAEQGTFVPPLRQPTFRENISVGSNEHAWVNSKLFFARLDYMLGRAQRWPTCSEFQKTYKVLPLHFCGGLTGSVGIQDRSPRPSQLTNRE